MFDTVESNVKNMIPVVGYRVHYSTNWGRAIQIFVSKLTSIAADNDWSPGQHQAIIWTNARILLIESLGTSMKFKSKSISFHSRISTWKCRLENIVQLFSASMC